MATPPDDHGMDIDVGQVDWLTLADPYILMFLDNCMTVSGNPVKQTPKTIALNTPLEQQHAGARCRELHEHGLLEKHGRGIYSISELGRRVVAGEVDAADLRSMNNG